MASITGVATIGTYNSRKVVKRKGDFQEAVKKCPKKKKDGGGGLGGRSEVPLFCRSRPSRGKLLGGGCLKAQHIIRKTAQRSQKKTEIKKGHSVCVFPSLPVFLSSRGKGKHSEGRL